MGDPAGIGPELALKAWMALHDKQDQGFVWIGDPLVLRSAALHLGLDVPITEISDPGEAPGVFQATMPVLAVSKTCGTVTAGTPDATHAGAIIEAISTGVDLCLSGAVSGLVTMPIAKAPLAAAGFGFPGHTEYVGALAPADPANPAAPMMMLCGPGLRVALATIHVRLGDVPGLLDTGRLTAQIVTLATSLQQDFGIHAPRIAVCGLNPHAGEEGLLGTEDAGIIAPAVMAAQALGLSVTGPHPADTLFHRDARARYDAVLAMYHDQGLVPLKMLAFWDGVNVTIGLPVVRTSPDHGTGFDIAGRGIARADSTLAAIALAGQIAASRQSRLNR